jgi:curved DNA-binding protein
MFGRNGGFQRTRSSGRQHMSMRGEDVHYELALLLEEAYSGAEQQLEYRVPAVDERGLVTHQMHKVKVKIPAGASAGSILRIKGHGAPGLGGADPGDLLLTIRLAEHPLYAVDGKNLSLVVPVAPWEAALGAKVTIPTLKSKTKVNVPAGSQSGQKLRLTGLGLPGNPPGDFYVVLKIVMPDKITPEAKALYEQLAQDTSFNPRSAWE